eukprot:TRINITY_DN1054_c1_g2_i1.p3 TRINITY_DN1054_c1_g2~~TRINITY_DN1054_c1_g2_i1.p3  ORF type:complete len:138 (+),score=32.40 TRINITY_DN1054_c1_g2_i1:67-480(+)
MTAVHAGPSPPAAFGPYTLRPGNPFDIHVYYATPAERDEAMTFRTRLQQAFPWLKFAAPWDRPIGPHPVPMWEADFGEPARSAEWDAVRRYVESEHGGLSVLIHPNTCDGGLADHTTYAYWVGRPVPLSLGIFGGGA